MATRPRACACIFHKTLYFMLYITSLCNYIHNLYCTGKFSLVLSDWLDPLGTATCIALHTCTNKCT